MSKIERRGRGHRARGAPGAMNWVYAKRGAKVTCSPYSDGGCLTAAAIFVGVGCDEVMVECDGILWWWVKP